MKVSVLGSGSGGNAVLVSADGTSILVDAGFSGRDLARRLDRVGVDADDVDAMVITHDHGDHTRGMGIFARRHRTPIHLTEATLEACRKLLRGGETVIPYRVGRPFAIGPLRVDPFVTVHDAADPVAVGVVDSNRGLKLGIATDLGRPTAQIRHAFARSDALVLEANHDDTLLHQGPYPASVKERITSSHGHLSNLEAAELARDLHHPRLAAVILAHLSVECNDPALACRTVGAALREVGFRGQLTVATQDEPTELLDLEELRQTTGPAQLSFL